MTNSLYLLAMVCFLAMVSPGPDFVIVSRNALRYPRPQALATAFGIVGGCLVHATYCILGLALLITKSVMLFSVLKYVGACYLMYLGIKGMFSRSQGVSPSPAFGRQGITLRQAFLEGFFCNVLNPKLAVFLLSLFTQFISPDAYPAEKAAVASIFLLESFVYWPLLVLMLQSSLVGRIHAVCRGALDRISGAVLLFLGLKVAFSRD